MGFSHFLRMSNCNVLREGQDPPLRRLCEDANNLEYRENFLTISIFENIIKMKILDNRELEVDAMPRAKFQTLTEQMFYILMCLKEECYGLDILDRVPQMTGKRVTVGSGTLYNLLEQFLEEGFIRETKVEGRRRSYILTDKGRTLLEREYDRLVTQAQDYNRVINREVSYGTEEDYAEQMGNMGLAPAY